jgi:ribosome maturation factor RimP
MLLLRFVELIMSKTEVQAEKSALKPNAMKNNPQNLASVKSEGKAMPLAPASLTNPQDRLIHFLETMLATIGYELVAIEILNHREKKLRVFIDTPQGSGIAVGIDDCVKATHLLDEPLEANKDVEAVFKGAYELEVSSPGIDRPLRKSSDYVRFAGQIGRIQTFRPLTAEETLAAEYSTKNPKQKNFFGMVRGYEGSTVLFGVIPEDGTSMLKTNKKEKKEKKETLIRIPHDLISKAHLEPEIEFSED